MILIHCLPLCCTFFIQWNLYKAETIGGKKSVRFIEMSAIYRFFLRKLDRKAKQSVPRHTVRLMKVCAL